MTNLWMGALKTAVLSLTALITALPVVDPLTFSIKTLGGWAHIAEVLIWVIIVNEARYWNQWASTIKGNNNGQQQSIK